MLKLLEEQEESEPIMSKHAMTIGTASSKSGCPASMIRYYESIGLLRPVARTANGRRAYDRPDVSRLQLIRRLRGFGFAIGQVRDLIGAIDEPTVSCVRVRDIARSQLDALSARRAELEALERSLTILTQGCSDICVEGRLPDCPILAEAAV
jgi:DNA-binding transcriptional MerR regulator